MPCEETKRHVQNYMGVVDLRPITEEDLAKHEGELRSDEELGPRIVDAATRRKTRVGGASMEKEDRRTSVDAECEKEKSREAMARGDAVRGARTSRKSAKRKNREGDGALRWDDAALQRAQAAAAASRAAEGSCAGETEGGPEVMAANEASASSVRTWRDGLADSGLNEGRRSVVGKVAHRALAQGFRSSTIGANKGE
eukprot:5275616-Pyramimonas_sp.AAC.1